MSAAAAATDATDVPKKKGSKKLMMIIGVVVLLLAIVGGGAFYMMQKRAAEAAAAAAAEGEDGEEAAPKAAAHGKKDGHVTPTFLPLEAFVVNLADREQDRFAQIGITLQVDDAKAADEIKAYLPAIRNNILLLLSHKTSQEMLQVEGKEKLARQVLREAVRPMGFDLEDEDEPEDDAASAAPAKKKKKRRAFDDPEDAPVKSVQFSSFIIQ